VLVYHLFTCDIVPFCDMCYQRDQQFLVEKISQFTSKSKILCKETKKYFSVFKINNKYMFDRLLLSVESNIRSIDLNILHFLTVIFPFQNNARECPNLVYGLQSIIRTQETCFQVVNKQVY